MKVPTPRKLSNGSWYIYLRLNGSSISVTDRSKASCIARARSIKAQYKAGELPIMPAGKAETLGDILTQYINKYAPVLSPATVRGYQTIRRCRFPDYMSTPVEKLPWQRMINDELGRVSPKTVRNAWGLVRVALRDAGKQLPPVRLAPTPVREIPFLQPEEIPLFLEAIKNDRAELPALLMLHGLRVSEVLGLTWEESIDLKAKRIRVLGAVVQGTNNQYVRKETNKNSTSTRTIDIMIPRLYELLRASQSPHGPLVTMRAHVILRHVKAACERAGVTVVGNHGLRHSAASLAYELGWSPRMIMEFFGWADMNTAHKVYIRIGKSRKAKAEDAMAQFYKNVN